jgi:chemotaxis-related protein WspB
MLFITFQLGTDRYGIDAGSVREILPLIRLKRLPQSPPGVAGLFNYHGTPVPVVDLSELALGQPSSQCFSTRILLTHYRDNNGQDRMVGLIAEKATGLIRRRADEVVDPQVKVGSAPYLGALLMDGTEVIQLIEHEKLLAAPIQTAIDSALGSFVG